MRDDLADVNNTANNNVSSIGDEKQKPVEKKQDQNKMNIISTKTSSSVATPITVPDKLKDEEISELKNLIGRISEDGNKEKIEKESVEKKDIPVNTTNKEVANKQQKPVDLKNNEEKELKNLINKISETIDKKEDSKVEEKKSAVKRIENKLDEKKEAKTEPKKTEENKQSFWSDISKKLKDNEVTELQRINALKEKDKLITKSVEDIKSVKKEEQKVEEIVKKKVEKTTEKTETVAENNNNSGILIKKELSETKEKIENKKKFYNNSNNYQSPENRLIFGKQKKYSSVSKRIKLKDKKDEIADLKNTNEMKEKQKIVSEKEKYKKLKSRVIKKYNIKLFLLPWKKIIPIALALIILTGVVSYFIFSNIKQPAPVLPVVIVGTEIEEFAKIENKVEFTKNDIIKMGFKENVINEKFREDNNTKELKIIIKDDNKIILLREALENIKVETENFPSSFWNMITKSYNIFAIKTEENDFRFVVAIESNDITKLLKTMGDWEQEEVEKRKMFNVFEPFFTDSKTEEDPGQYFQSANYKNINLRYINLPDKFTSFDYFASDNILVITTSKENAGRIIDILSDDNY